MTVLVVTGTDTGVGKTVVTAAIAAAVLARGAGVAVIKAAQTGPDDDAGVVERLSGAEAHALARYPEPLAPLTAARRAGREPLPMAAAVKAVRAAEAATGLVLVEGAGGLLVALGAEGWTVADLCTELDTRAVVVARCGLGTLNHTALTLEALARRDIGAEVVIGAVPAVGEPVHRTNLTDLREVYGVGSLGGKVPEGAGALSPEEFQAGAPSWLSPRLWGSGVF